MSELGSAVERHRKLLQTGDYVDVYGPRANRETALRIGEDRLLLSDAYIAHLDQQAAEAREGELPIDAEWLESIGFVSVPSDRGPNYPNHMELGRVNIWEFNGTGEWLLTEADRLGFRERGQILALLAALKVSTKGE